MKTALLHRKNSPHGFSLIEMLVSVSILSLLMLLVFQMLDKTQQIWKKSRDSISQYKDARIAFESITRRLSQATLNTYWDYEYTTGAGTQVNGFNRNSQLHYISGPSDQVIGTGGANGVERTTHCLFFHAPTGYTEVPSTEATNRGQLKYGEFQDLLNAWGYFVEFGDDSNERPAFISSLPGQGYIKPRARFRLMEFAQPAEGVQIYYRNAQDKLMTDNTTKANSVLSSWFLNSGRFGINYEKNYSADGASSNDLSGKNTRLLAENIIALIVLPNESQSADLRYKLAPNYYYDTRAYRSSIGSQAGSDAGSLKENLFKSRNQLPPIVDVAMIAVDEADFNRYAQAKDIVDRSGFTSANFTQGLFSGTGGAARYDADLLTLNDRLSEASPPIHYKVFRASVRLREAKWGGFSLQ